MKKAFNFRAVLVCVLVLVMCLTAFVACNKKDNQYDMSSLENAKSYLKSIYKELGPTTPSNFDLVVKVPGANAGVFHDIEWTVTVLTEGEETSITVVPGTDKVTIQVPEKASQDINYTLTATIKDGDHNVKLEYNLTVPKWRELTWAEYMSKTKGEAVILKGKVASISSKSTGDKYNCMYIYDNDGGYYIYSLNEDPLTTYPNLALGMTVQVSGTKDIYYGTHEVTKATFTVLDDSTTIEFADITDIFAATTDMKDESLTKKAYMPVEIKNVIIGDIDTASSYYYFSIGANKSYLRVSSSDNMLSDDETKAFKDGFAALNGKYATVKGMATVYNGAFYIQVITTDAAVEQEAPERDPAGQIADVKGRLAIDTAISGSGRTFTLPTQDTVYTDVKIAWAASSEIAKIENGKVTYTFTEGGTVTLTATLTHATDATVSDTKEFTVTLNLGTEITIADLYKAKKGDTVYIVTGYVVAAGGDHNTAGSFVIADATGSIFSYEKAQVEVGDYVQVIGTRDEQYSLAQLATISVKQLTGGNFVEAQPEEISVADVKVDGSTLYTGQFYKIVGGTLKVVVDGSKTYINLMNGETRMVSLYGDVLVDTMKALDGKEVVVYGYSRGVNTNQKYWQLQVTRIETNEPVKSDADKVAEAKAALDLGVTTTGVSFKLPLVGENDATISWESDNTAVIAINGEDAVVTAPAQETVVKLTATITVGEAHDTKEFNVTVTVTIPEFDVTITQPAAGGSIEVKNGTEAIASGKFQQGTVLTITATPADANHELVAIKVNGKAITAVDGVYSVTVTEAVEITAEFKEIKYATITIATIENGTITVKNGEADVNNNDSLRDGTVLTITATANEGYRVTAIKVNGNAITGKTYTIKETDETIEISATIELLPTCNVDGAELKTIAELEALIPNAGDSTKEMYYTMGFIKSVNNTKFGNATLEDFSGKTFTIYGLYDFAGSTRYDSLATKPVAGDFVVLYGTLSNYNGTKEMVNARIAQLNDTVYAPSYADKIAGAKEALTLESEYGKDFNLPENGLNGTTISWVSDNTEVVNIAENPIDGQFLATVVVPATDTVVNLTATISIGGVQDTKVFAITVKANSKVTITFTTSENGTFEVKANDTALESGAELDAYTTVTVTVAPAEGYRLASYAINDGEAVTTVVGKTEFTFDITENTTLTVTFGELPSTKTVTATYSTKTTANMTAGANNADKIGLDANIFSVTSAKVGGSVEVGLNKDGTIRLYKGGTTPLTITVAEGYEIVSIKVTLGATQGTLVITNGTDTISATDGVYTINGNKVVLNNTSTSSQCHIKSIEIIYK